MVMKGIASQDVASKAHSLKGIRLSLNQINLEMLELVQLLLSCLLLPLPMKSEEYLLVVDAWVYELEWEGTADGLLI